MAVQNLVNIPARAQMEAHAVGKALVLAVEMNVILQQHVKTAITVPHTSRVVGKDVLAARVVGIVVTQRLMPVILYIVTKYSCNSASNCKGVR